MNELKLIRRDDSSSVRLAIIGEIDIYNIGKIRESLVELTEGCSEVQFELTELNFIDSTGLGMLIGLARQLKGKNGSVVLINPRPQVQKLLETTGLDTVFEIRKEDDYIA